MSSRLHRTTVSSPDASKRSLTVCEIPGNGSSPPPSHPTAPPHSDALISEPAGFYSFSRGVFPLRQLLALFTAARHGNRSCRRRSAPRRKLHCPPHSPSPHTQGCFVSGRTVTAQNQHQKASGGRQSYLRLGISPSVLLVAAASRGV